MTDKPIDELTDDEKARKRGVSARVYRASGIIARAAAAAGSPMGPDQADAVAGDVCAWLHEMTETELRDACSAAWTEYQAGGRTYGYPGAGSIAACMRRARAATLPAAHADVLDDADSEASPYKRGPDCIHQCRAGVVTLLCPDGYEVAVACDCSGGAARRIQQTGLYGKSRGASACLADGWGYLRDDPEKLPVTAAMVDWCAEQVRAGESLLAAARRWRAHHDEATEARSLSAEWMR